GAPHGEDAGLLVDHQDVGVLVEDEELVAGAPARAQRHREAARSEPMFGARHRPRSVMMPASHATGVTSNAGFRTFTPLGTICTPPTCVTSRAGRSSITISAPEAIERSTVDHGA